MSNFGFIRAQWPALYAACQGAESYALADADDAAHGNRRFTPREGVATLRDLFDVVVWTVEHHSTVPEAAPLGSTFDVTIAQKRAPLVPAQVRKLAERFAQQKVAARQAIAARDARTAASDATLTEHEARLAAQDAELDRLRQRIAAAQAEDTAADRHDYREDETRSQLIDELQRDAGWMLASVEDR